jgi:hypothetical protein
MLRPFVKPVVKVLLAALLLLLLVLLAERVSIPLSLALVLVPLVPWVNLEILLLPPFVMTVRLELLLLHKDGVFAQPAVWASINPSRAHPFVLNVQADDLEAQLV